MEHLDYKFEGDTGYLERKRIIASAVFHIGKEANNIDEQAIGVKKPQEFWSDEDWMKYIFDMSYSEAEKIGIPRNTLKYWRKKERESQN